MEEMGFAIPIPIQALLLLAQLPSPEMDGVANDLAADDIEEFNKPNTLDHIRQRLNVYWENKCGKKAAGNQQQKANKITAVKKDQGQPSFSDQHDRGEESSRGGRGQGRGRGRRGKRGGQKQANQTEEDKEHSRSRPSSSMGMLASSIFMRPPPPPAPPVFPPPPPSSIYPSFNSALSLAR